LQRSSIVTTSWLLLDLAALIVDRGFTHPSESITRRADHVALLPKHRPPIDSIPLEET
jgi:hypothetical protein